MAPIIHTADIHLDSPMRGLDRYDGAPVESLRGASRIAFANLIDVAIEREVDALVIAGDAFDGDWQDYGTGAFFVRQLQRLKDVGIPVVMARGNHDALNKMTRALLMPENVQILSADEPQTVVDIDGFAFHGQSFATAAVTEDLSLAYPDPVPGLVNVGVLHTCATGREGHDRYAPCDPERLARHGYDYWALGHVHERETLAEEAPVVFSGCLQGRNIRETGPKGATLVTFEGGEVEREELVLDHVRWLHCKVDVSSAGTLEEVVKTASGQFAVEAREAGDRLVAVRVELTGKTGAHSLLAKSRERLFEELALALEDVHPADVWIEKVVLRTSPLASIKPAGDDAMSALVERIEALGKDEGLLTELAGDLEDLRNKLPLAVLEQFDPTDPETIKRLVTEAGITLPTLVVEGGE